MNGHHLGLTLGAATMALALTAGAQTTPPAPTFLTAQQAADALIAAANDTDIAALERLFGPGGRSLVVTGDTVQDRNRIAEFAARAREGSKVVVDPANASRATLFVGSDDWPLPVPLVKRGGQWLFDAAGGQQEVLHRRIGSNELDAIEVCRGFVEAQHEYALIKRAGSPGNQYARRIISTPGTQDGLAWQESDGSWSGPIGEEIARAIQQGYSENINPYHGYYYKVLMGQGPAAPLGALDFVIKDAMIGGFALVASPAEYGVTGVLTFMVSHDGVVYEKDLGAGTLNAFKAMERFNPDPTWTPVDER
jgi:hypothetical protein